MDSDFSRRVRAGEQVDMTLERLEYTFLVVEMEFVPRCLANACVLSFQSYFLIPFSSCTSNSNSNTLYIHISSAIRPPTLNLTGTRLEKGAVHIPDK
jgi:hypothetical protein